MPFLDRQRFARIVSPSDPDRAAPGFRLAYHATITAGLAAMFADTWPGLPPMVDHAMMWTTIVAWGVLVLEFALRLWVAPSARHADSVSDVRMRVHYITGPRGFIDFLAVLALPTGWVFGTEHTDANLFCILWSLKLFRYSTGLTVLLSVIRNERTALLSVLTTFAVVLLLSSTLAYSFEREGQPDTFGSIPSAMWWAIVTLTTTGYGDATPATLWGRSLAGIVMVCGLAVFALMTGILANGFAQELRRRDFLRTWDLVARVPYFRDVGAAVIAEVVRMLRPQEVRPNTILFRRGETGQAMYFIVSGEIEMGLRPRPIRLSDGNFFGEMALISGSDRSATATATRRTLLLSLDVADFRDLAARRPELLKAIHEEAEKRRLINAGAMAAAAPKD